MRADESGKRGQEKDHEGLVHQINSVHIYPAGDREPATTSKQERGGFMHSIRRSLGEGSLRAQRSQRKGSSAGASGRGTETFKQGNQSSSSDAHSCVVCKMGSRQEHCLGLGRPLRENAL